MYAATRLRSARERVVADITLRGPAFGAALADACDEAIVESAAALAVKGKWAVIALGSYARRELCPGSDLDVVLIHAGGARGSVADAAARSLWYPFWDAGFTLGQATRTPKEALRLADEDLDALTAMLDIRVVAGDAEFAHDLHRKACGLAVKRKGRVIPTLATAADARYTRPGPVAEMLEPNLKDGAGGLRDLHALGWAGVIAGGTGLDGLVAAGVISGDDVDVLEAANVRLLDVRVALHRVTGGRSDLLTMQEQDFVARLVGAADADTLLRELADAARQVGWISRDAWARLESGRKGPGGRVVHRDRRLDEDVVLREDRVVLAADAPVTLTSVLRVAAAAAEQDAAIDRATLARLGAVDGAVEWGAEDRATFFRLLRAGRPLVAVFEALDHVGALVRLLPEWEHVRARPQRNAYHRFTVDRHLLETVVEADRLLDERDFDGEMARRARFELLLLGAITHDIGKGAPGDHSDVGAARASELATRIGLENHAVVLAAWLVQYHLLLADTATRRDLGAEETIVRFGRAVQDTERLDLLYALTIADSRATGSTAWSSAKAALCRQLFVETDSLLERGVAGSTIADERRAVLDRHRELLEDGELAVVWNTRDDGALECTVVAPDRRGLLAAVAGVLTLVGFDIQSAAGFSDPDTNMALEVYRGVDQFGRLDDAGQRDFVTMLRSALSGALPLRERVSERVGRYRGPADPGGAGVDVLIDFDASASSTIIEVHAPDQVGLLASVAAVFADLDIDVSVALVATSGTRAVDVFYVRDEHGAKPSDPKLLQRLRATLIARLTTDYVLPKPQ
jgi:[protein-PII] uridylyltransferase